MEDSLDMESMESSEPQTFLFGCELKADKREFQFHVDDENEHQLALHTVSLGAEAKDELHVVEAEGLNYEGKPTKIVLASLKISVQPMVSLGGFAITPPLVLRLKSGSGPVHVSGQHLVALDEDLESDEDEDDDILEASKKPAAKRAASVTLQGARKKVKLEEEDDDHEDEEYDLDSDEEEEEEEDEEEWNIIDYPMSSSLYSYKCNFSCLLYATIFLPPPPPNQTSESNKQGNKPLTPKSASKPQTPKPALSIEEIKVKMQQSVEKGVFLPKVEAKFFNFVKNGFRQDNPKVIQELWKWRQSLKDGK
nr:PREDICTED: nucleophosmin [Latimeria chalumnae]|eukprot:XP_014347777.1 PREDICTED: nucleophosmin [Latimeria chalumnae]